jgi:hypothetical protein
MEFNSRTFGLAALVAAIVATAATATMACSKDPQLNVQNTPQPAPAATQGAPAEPAATAAPAGELPAGHPAVALPPGHPPAGQVPGGMPGGNPGGMGAGMGSGMSDAAGIALPPVDPQGGLGAAGLVWDVPASWIAEPPANAMRRAQYRVRGAAGDAELVVFYFGPNQGGPPLDNAQRWAMQFTQPGGGDPLAALQTRSGDIHGIPALFVETTGTYNPGTMSAGPAVAKENFALLGVVAQGGDANWFFKFTGPKPTVEAERAAFEAMVGSLRRGG